VKCPKCGIAVIEYSSLVESLKQGLRESPNIEHRRVRAHTRRWILEELERLDAL